jgi:hypothetical protein
MGYLPKGGDISFDDELRLPSFEGKKGKKKGHRALGEVEPLDFGSKLNLHRLPFLPACFSSVELKVIRK